MNKKAWLVIFLVWNGFVSSMCCSSLLCLRTNSVMPVTMVKDNDTRFVPDDTFVEEYFKKAKHNFESRIESAKKNSVHCQYTSDDCFFDAQILPKVPQPKKLWKRFACYIYF